MHSCNVICRAIVRWASIGIPAPEPVDTVRSKSSSNSSRRELWWYRTGWFRNGLKKIQINIYNIFLSIPKYVEEMLTQQLWQFGRFAPIDDRSKPWLDQLSAHYNKRCQCKGQIQRRGQQRRGGEGNTNGLCHHPHFPLPTHQPKRRFQLGAWKKNSFYFIHFPSNASQMFEGKKKFIVLWKIVLLNQKINSKSKPLHRCKRIRLYNIWQLAQVEKCSHFGTQMASHMVPILLDKHI